MQRRNNQLLIDAVNMHRLTSGLKPLRQADPKLYEFAQNVADRMLSIGKVSAPSFTKFSDKKTALLAVMISGETTVKEFIYDLNDGMFIIYKKIYAFFFKFLVLNIKNIDVIGSVGCFDNFSNQRAKVYNIFSLNSDVCNKAIVDNYSKFDAFGTGVAFNNDGDLVSVFVLSEVD